MLSAKILNKTASLNSFDVIGSLKFIPGEKTKLVLQLIQEDRDDELRYVAPATATLKVKAWKTDNTQSELTMTADAADRSMWSVDLSSEDTDSLAGGNITFDLDLLGDASDIEKGWVENALQRVVTGL